jgi:hypothetical protein
VWRFRVGTGIDRDRPFITFSLPIHHCRWGNGEGRRGIFAIVSFQDNSPSQISDSGNKQYYRSSFSEKPGRHSLFQPVFFMQGDSPSSYARGSGTGEAKVFSL